MLVAMETKSHDSSDTGVYKQAMNVRGKEGEGEQSCEKGGYTSKLEEEN